MFNGNIYSSTKPFLPFISPHIMLIQHPHFYEAKAFKQEIIIIIPFSFLSPCFFLGSKHIYVHILKIFFKKKIIRTRRSKSFRPPFYTISLYIQEKTQILREYRHENMVYIFMVYSSVYIMLDYILENNIEKLMITI